MKTCELYDGSRLSVIPNNRSRGHFCGRRLAPGPVTTAGMSMIEIMMATAILASAFIPVVQYTRSSVREAGVSREEILARHYLMDMVERFKGSPVGELSEFPATEPSIPLGRENENSAIRHDAMLNDQERIASTMAAQRGTDDPESVGEQGVQFFLDLAKAMKLTRIVTFQEIQPMSQGRPGMYQLSCIIRWQSQVLRREKRVEFSKLLVRRPPFPRLGQGNPGNSM